MKMSAKADVAVVAVAATAARCGRTVCNVKRALMMPPPPAADNFEKSPSFDLHNSRRCGKNRVRAFGAR